MERSFLCDPSVALARMESVLVSLFARASGPAPRGLAGWRSALPSATGCRMPYAAPKLAHSSLGPAAVNPYAEHDAALVGRIATGDQHALGQLYDRYADVLLALSMRILKSQGEAEDLLHDVFVEVWRKAADFDSTRGTVRAWLVTRTRSRALDRCKSPGRARSNPLDDVEHRLEVSAENAGEYAEHERLRAAVLSLTPEQRAVMECAYFDGLSSSEIALHLGIPIGTVKSRMAAGLARLRSLLGVL